MRARILLCFSIVSGLGWVSQPLRAQGDAGIGFPSPMAALQAPRARKDVEFSEREGWTMVLDRSNQTVWLFAHEGDAAFPTAVKRTPVQSGDGSWHVGSRIMCGASRPVCDRIAT